MIKLKTKYFVFLLSTLVIIVVNGQTITQDFTQPVNKGFRCQAEILNGDTIPVFYCNYIEVITTFQFKNHRQFEYWTRTKHNVKKVYPYALLAAAKLKEYDKALSAIKDENTKKAFLKICEKDLRNEFEDELKGLSVSQGRILMKLIDRETGKTTYEIVKQLRGNFQACFWQALASLFGNSMKVQYDPIEDVMVERAIKLVETGQF